MFSVLPRSVGNLPGETELQRRVNVEEQYLSLHLPHMNHTLYLDPSY